jgi:hypothetical protein
MSFLKGADHRQKHHKAVDSDGKGLVDTYVFLTLAFFLKFLGFLPAVIDL